MSLTRIHNLSISLDGFATGEPQSAEAPFGQRASDCTSGCSLPGSGTRAEPPESTTPSLSATVTTSAPRSWAPNKFGPPGWRDDPQWQGWWGPNPPFHTPTFVLTHHPRPSIEMEGGTTFHFLDAAPAEALATAR